jgi:hypothetical protein
MVDTDELLKEFVRLLTTDSVQQDRRRRDFNQAVFMDDGKPVWTETTLDMIASKYWKAVRNLERRGKGEHPAQEGGFVPKPVMLKVAGKRFVCPRCHATVQTKIGPDRFTCNGCGDEFRGEQK